MMVNKRVEETMFSDKPEVDKNKNKEYRMLPSHMYGGPKGFGDPTFRGMSKMEEDPLIPQRMRDIARTQMCDDFAHAYNMCGKDNVCIAGRTYFYGERGERGTTAESAETAETA